MNYPQTLECSKDRTFAGTVVRPGVRSTYTSTLYGHTMRREGDGFFYFLVSRYVWQNYPDLTIKSAGGLPIYSQAPDDTTATLVHCTDQTHDATKYVPREMHERAERKIDELWRKLRECQEYITHLESHAMELGKHREITLEVGLGGSELVHRVSQAFGKEINKLHFKDVEEARREAEQFRHDVLRVCATYSLTHELADNRVFPWEKKIE